MATIDKAVGPLLASVVLSLYPLMSGGSVDYSTLLTALTGLITFGVVYFVKYSATAYNKSIAAFVAPVLIALLSAYQTGDFNSPELLLAIQAVVGALVTYAAKRVDILPAEVPLRTEPGAAESMRRRRS